MIKILVKIFRNIPPLKISMIVGTILSLMINPARAQSCTSLRGVNIAGAEFGTIFPGTYNRDYIYPSKNTITYFAQLGASVVRLPFSWERLQHKQNSPLYHAELERLKMTIKDINDAGMQVILDPHNYARYYSKVVGSSDVPNAAFADFWIRLATQFKNNEMVIFSLTNEPFDIPARQWLRAANAGISAIRSVGARQLILVPGVHYSGAHFWSSNLPDGNNSRVMRHVRDPLNNFAYDLHQYLDEDFSGRNATCPRSRDALKALKSVTRWLARNNARGFLGEFGGSSAPECIKGIAQMARFINDNPDQWIGWTYWAAGDWWPEDYLLSVQPKQDGQMRPQMATLLPHLKRPACPVGEPLDLSLKQLRR